jgi:hypothetical protein
MGARGPPHPARVPNRSRAVPRLPDHAAPGHPSRRLARADRRAPARSGRLPRPGRPPPGRPSPPLRRERGTLAPPRIRRPADPLRARAAASAADGPSRRGRGHPVPPRAHPPPPLVSPFRGRPSPAPTRQLPGDRRPPPANPAPDPPPPPPASPAPDPPPPPPASPAPDPPPPPPASPAPGPPPPPPASPDPGPPPPPPASPDPDPLPRRVGIPSPGLPPPAGDPARGPPRPPPASPPPSGLPRALARHPGTPRAPTPLRCQLPRAAPTAHLAGSRRSLVWGARLKRHRNRHNQGCRPRPRASRHLLPRIRPR